jgi:Fusaric acid resistance protein-like
VGLAGLIAVGLHPAGGVTVVLVGVLAWLGYSLFPASFAVGFTFITALVVFLLNAVSPDTLSTAVARLIDTLIGGALGLLVYALWPTWSRGPAWRSVADLVAAERAYADAVLTAIREGVRAREDDLRPLARRARLARTQAEAVVSRSQTEPATRQIDARQSQAVLGALRRLMQSAHVLRLDVQEKRRRRARPEIEPFQLALNQLLQMVEERLRALPAENPAAAPLPDLRGAFRKAQRAWGDDPDTRALTTELDEIVDAANGLAAAAGLRPDELEPEPAPAPETTEHPLRRRLERWLPGTS